jgi:hypothetical protein
MLTVEIKRLVFGPAAQQDFQPFFEAAGPRFGVHPEHPKFHSERLRTLADANVQASVGENIEHGELLG